MIALTACGPQYYKGEADKEVYEILQKKHAELFDTEELYEIEQLTQDPLLGLAPAAEAVLETPAGFERFQQPPLIISFEKALEIAAYNNHAYQNEKENVYLCALDLTEKRHDFSEQFGGILSGYHNRSPDDKMLTGSGNFSVTKLLKTGARIGINLTMEFLRYLTGDPRRSASSVLAVNIIQPLWRGAGKKIAMENLTQAERNVIYKVRSFARFKETFTINIASSYYNILQQRIIVRNEQKNHQSLAAARERADMLAIAGRLPAFQAEQAKQDEWNAKNRWISAITDYYGLLNDFKIELGISPIVNVDLDEKELTSLTETVMYEPEITLDDALASAQTGRLDLKNAEDRVADAQRKIGVTTNGLAPKVDLSVESTTPSGSDNRPGHLKFNQSTIKTGLKMELPFNRLSERNVYRKALIDLERAKREYAVLSDQIKLQVQKDWYKLKQAKALYDIQKESVDLAVKRVESMDLLLQAGRAETRDLLDSQKALIEAQNTLIRSLTGYKITRLQLDGDMGVFKPGDKSYWQAENEPVTE